MQHVCLIQSISARKATRIKLGTCSGSSQCQLQFGTKMVSIGWSGCEWLPSECKNAHFQAFLLLAPSAILPTFWPVRQLFYSFPLCNNLWVTHRSFNYPQTSINHNITNILAYQTALLFISPLQSFRGHASQPIRRLPASPWRFAHSFGKGCRGLKLPTQSGRAGASTEGMSPVGKLSC